jgi:hypothetical protein
MRIDAEPPFGSISALCVAFGGGRTAVYTAAEEIGAECPLAAAHRNSPAAAYFLGLRPLAFGAALFTLPAAAGDRCVREEAARVPVRLAAPRCPGFVADPAPRRAGFAMPFEPACAPDATAARFGSVRNFSRIHIRASVVGPTPSSCASW